MKKDQGSVGRHGTMQIRSESEIGYRQYPVDLRSPPLLQKGNSYRELLANTAPPAIACNPSKKKRIKKLKLVLAISKKNVLLSKIKIVKIRSKIFNYGVFHTTYFLCLINLFILLVMARQKAMHQ